LDDSPWPRTSFECHGHQNGETELEKGKSRFRDDTGLRASNPFDRILAFSIADGAGLVLAADGELITLPLDVLPCEGGLLIDRFTNSTTAMLTRSVASRKTDARR
jgi:hypothetical protein